MGQYDVIDYLKVKYRQGEHKFIPVSEIRKDIKAGNIWQQIIKLELYGFVKMKYVKIGRRKVMAVRLTYEKL